MKIDKQANLHPRAIKQGDTRPVTIKDVAQRAGVTKATVSFTLSGKRNISPETKEAIFKAVQELGYVPNPYAQGLANGGSDKTVGVLWDLDLGVSTEQATSISHCLDEAGFICDLHITPSFVSDTDLLQSRAVDALCRQQPRAIICRSNKLGDPALIRLWRYVQEGGTVVCYGSKRNQPFDHVVFDKGRNIYRAAQHLLDLGHRKIGLSVQENAVSPDDPAILGFQRALSERQVEVREDWIWGNCCYEQAGACLAESFLKLKERPTAICIINDVTASTFITYLHRHGIRVPEDVSVVGYDDSPAARHALVPLTTISHPIAEVVQLILECLLSRLDGSYDGPERLIEIEGDLIIRESTAAPST